MKFLRFPKRRASLAEKRLVQMASGNDVLSMLASQNELADLNGGARTLAAKMVGSVDEFKFGDVGNMGKKGEIDRAEEKREGAIDFLLGDTGLSEGVRAKALQLSNERGIKFRQDVPYSPGLPDIRVYGTSAEEISRAIAMIYGNIESASGDLVFTPPEKVYLESDRDYRIRSDADYANFTSSILGSSLASAKDAREWRVLLSVLNAALSKTTALTDIKQRIDGGVDGEEGEPGAIDEVSDEDRLDNLGAYKDMLKEAAIQNASVLSGKEKLLTSQDYVDVMEDVLAENPAAIIYMTKKSKLSREKITVSGGPGNAHIDISVRDYYRDRMVTSSESDGAILESFRGNDEYEQYWKKHPEQFKKIAVNSIRNNPALLLEPDLWRREDIPKAQTLIDMVDSLDSATLIGVLKSLDAGNMSALQDYENNDSVGYIAFVEKVLYKGGSRPNIAAKAQVSPYEINLDAVIVISRYPDLISIVKEKEVLYNDYKDALAKIGTNERRKLINDVDELRGDEDIMIAELNRVFKGAVGLTGENLDRYMQNNYQSLANIPPHILFTEEFESNGENVAVRDIMMKFFETGDAFRNAPDEWKRDDQIVRAVVRKNASAYKYIDSSLKQGDATGVEILLNALTAEKRGKGNMHWEDVSLDMKRFLASKGVKGIASTRQMVDISFLGEVQKEKPTKGDDVESPFDNKDTIKFLKKLKDKGGNFYKDAVMDKLLEHTDKPEWLLDTELGTNTTAIKQLMATESDYFIFIDHDSLKDDDSYKDVVRTAVAKNSKYIADVHTNVLKPEFILELSGNNQAKLAELIAQLGTDQATDPELLALLVTSKMFDGNSAELIAFLDTVLVDELDGVTLLELIPSATLKANPKLIIAYFSVHNPKDFKQLKKDVQEDLDIVSRLLDTNMLIFEHIPHEDLMAKDDKKYISFLSQAFAANNDNLQFAPDAFLEDPEALATLAIQNGGFVTFENMMALVPPRLRTDEFVEKVMTVLEDNFKDEIEAEYKIGRAKFSSDDLPEALFDFVENRVLTGDNANRSVIKYWPKEMQKDKDRVIGYLRDKKNPKNIALVHKDLRSDQGFIEILLKEPGYGLDIFPYLDHDFLYPNKEFYENLVTRIIKERPELFKYTYESMQSDMDTLWRISGENLDTFQGLISRMSPQILSDPSQIARIMEVINTVEPEKALEFIDKILPDVAYTGTNFINTLLIDNNAKLIVQLVERNPAFALSDKVPASVLSRGVLEQLVLIVMPQDTELAKMVLLKAPQAERFAFIASHPRTILSLFRDSSLKMMEFIGEENLTVELLRHVISYYDTNEALWTLRDAAKVKPRVAEGVLLERPDLFINAPQKVKDEIFIALGNTAIDTIIARYDSLAEVQKEKPMLIAKMRLQTERQKLLAIRGLYTQEEVDAVEVFVTIPGNTTKDRVTFASVDLDFEEAGDFSTTTVEHINSLAHYHRLILDALNASGTIDQVANDDNTLKDAVINPDLTIPVGLNGGDTKTIATQEFLKNTYERVKTMDIPEEKKKAVLDTISTEMLKQFEALRADMVDTTKSPAIQQESALRVLIYLETASEMWLKKAPAGLDMQKIRNYKKEANTVINRLKNASKPTEVGPPLDDDQEAFYNLTKQEQRFNSLINSTIGTNKLALALGMSKISKPFLQLQMNNILAKVATATDDEKDAFEKCYAAIGGTAEEAFTASTLSKLTIAADVLKIPNAAEIIAATASNHSYDDMPAALYVKTVEVVSARLKGQKYAFRFSTEDILNTWNKASEELDRSSLLFDERGWTELEATLSTLLKMDLKIQRGEGTKFSIVRKTDEGDKALYFETENKDGSKWVVTSALNGNGHEKASAVGMEVTTANIIAFTQSNTTDLMTTVEITASLEESLSKPRVKSSPKYSKKVTEAERTKMSDLQADLIDKIGETNLTVRLGGPFHTSEYEVQGRLKNTSRSNGSLMSLYVNKDNYNNITSADYYDASIGKIIDLKIPNEGTVYDKIKTLMKGEELE